MAASKSDGKAAALLLAAGAAVDAADGKGATPLIVAVRVIKKTTYTKQRLPASGL